MSKHLKTVDFDGVYRVSLKTINKLIVSGLSEKILKAFIYTQPKKHEKSKHVLFKLDRMAEVDFEGNVAKVKDNRVICTISEMVDYIVNTLYLGHKFKRCDNAFLPGVVYVQNIDPFINLEGLYKAPAFRVHCFRGTDCGKKYCTVIDDVRIHTRTYRASHLHIKHFTPLFIID